MGFLKAIGRAVGLDAEDAKVIAVIIAVALVVVLVVGLLLGLLAGAMGVAVSAFTYLAGL